jgi:parvulin-like peptidyl-prolyl isomerase
MKSMMQQRGLTPEKLKQDMRANLQEQRWLTEQIKGGGEVTDAEAEAFYKKNPDKFEKPEQVRASHILVSVPADAKPEVVVEKQKAAQALYDRVKKGEPFDKLAAELSEDPSAKQNSGDLDYFTRERMVPEFSEVAFKMNKDEISEPVRSQFGYHVIKVTDRKPAATVTLEEAKPKLVAFLKQQKRQGEIEKVIRGIREQADVKINLPAPAPSPAAAAPAESKAP